MTPTASHQAGNSRREQLISALVVGGVLVVLGAASGLGIDVTSSAAPLVNALPQQAATVPTRQPNTDASAPINYIGTAGPGNLPAMYPSGVAVTTTGPSTPSSDSKPTTSTTAAPTTSASPLPTGSSTVPTLSCPPDVVTGLLDVLLGNKGLLGGGGLLSTVLSVVPNLANLLNGAGLSAVLTTDVGHLSAAQTDSMAQACTPVLSGLLGGGS